MSSIKAICPHLMPLLALCAVLTVGILPPPVQAADDCVSTDCHPTMGTGTWVHGPVGAGACSVCHVAVAGTDHRFEFAAAKEELCLACHEDSREVMLQENIHTPVAEGNCTGCHDPHQSPYRFALRAEASELCFQCHSREEFQGKMTHAPVASGDCTVCHDPHASPHVSQLLEAPEDLCFSCHEEKEADVQKRHVHEPVARGCTNCHQPHASEANNLLAEDSPGLCFTCHPDQAKSTAVDHPHAPVTNGSCQQCHDSHASDFPRLFPTDPANLCFSCHTELGEYIADQQYKHGPVQDGDCSACHDPHGSDHFRSLHKDFPESFYVEYAEENYDLCFECHNRQFAQDEKTRTLTGFRDGDRNLHHLHVNKVLKGRSCKACHQVHASSQGMHIRLSVPYGSINWELPIKFTKTPDGGSCQVGCHSPKGYTRK